MNTYNGVTAESEAQHGWKNLWREECRLLGEGGTYGKLAGSLENVKQKVESNDCSDVGGVERKRGPRTLQSVQSLIHGPKRVLCGRDTVIS